MILICIRWNPTQSLTREAWCTRIHCASCILCKLKVSAAAKSKQQARVLRCVEYLSEFGDGWSLGVVLRHAIKAGRGLLKRWERRRRWKKGAKWCVRRRGRRGRKGVVGGGAGRGLYKETAVWSWQGKKWRRGRRESKQCYCFTGFTGQEEASQVCEGERFHWPILQSLDAAWPQLPPLAAPSSGPKPEIPPETSSIKCFHSSLAAMKVSFFYKLLASEHTHPSLCRLTAAVRLNLTFQTEAHGSCWWLWLQEMVERCSHSWQRSDFFSVFFPTFLTPRFCWITS